MGQQSGATADTSAAYQKGQSNTTQNSTTNTDYSKNATFNPAGAGALASLGGAYQNAGQNSEAATNYYKQQMGGGNVNPYMAELAKAQGLQADQAYSEGMKGVRSAGYGGGVGSNYIDQSKLTANYANQKSSNNANLLAQAFQQQQQQQNNAASGLSGQTNDVMNFLSLLRGEQGTGVSKTLGEENTKTAGTKLGQSFGFSKG